MTAMKLALVTGANRGIGFEVCRQLLKKGFQVILTARTLEKAQQAVQQLGSEKVTPVGLEVTSSESVEQLRQWLEATYGGLDVLINNAGIYPDEGQSILRVPVDTFREAMNVNAFAALELSQALFPLLENRRGQVINVSSEMGAWEDLHPSTSAYRLSKLALNGITLMLSRAGRGRVAVNSVCPGWVRTDMGGQDAPGTVEEGAEGIVWLAEQVRGTGQFYQHRQILPW
ncbi:SDR family NAD(P)-dependent oxidoreductase [Deinococcus cellulosilyticus]|uniref:Short-chain dehydrogenase n=1 Tax=Deinococcus cellulosilyticus (strain DSM 18568 / NBRC 106333 / KACC 11606 / 5516J-15) TaxID=1223518 RepID=A0A511N5F3_DEIC1|nr:SDR family NAD(P)-dependent oxidoreductase [Deinococcus cellulosilyticus]GEM48064.1 short-chain dehydrogenase [Deinococcus cellulosilyticus NBRC 106333 = KACC 11606]